MDEEILLRSLGRNSGGMFVSWWRKLARCPAPAECFSGCEGVARTHWFAEGVQHLRFCEGHEEAYESRSDRRRGKMDLRCIPKRDGPHGDGWRQHDRAVRRTRRKKQVDFRARTL